MSETTTALRHANFIAGAWSASATGRTYERHNPCRPPSGAHSWLAPPT
jgi:hypothetical protein